MHTRAALLLAATVAACSSDQTRRPDSTEGPDAAVAADLTVAPPAPDLWQLAPGSACAYAGTCLDRQCAGPDMFGAPANFRDATGCCALRPACDVDAAVCAREFIVLGQGGTPNLFCVDCGDGFRCRALDAL